MKASTMKILMGAELALILLGMGIVLTGGGLEALLLSCAASGALLLSAFHYIDVLKLEIAQEIGETRLRFEGLKSHVSNLQADYQLIQKEWASLEATISEDEWEKLLDRMGTLELALNFKRGTQKTNLLG